MKRILIPTDFSIQAENALKVAVQMARKNDAELYLLHSMEMPLHLANTATGALPEALYFIKLAEKQFAELMQRPYLDGLAVNEAIGHGEIYNDIRETIKKNEIDLVVMGSHGASGFREMFIGSNTEKVVRTSEIPVLVIKNDHPHFEINDFVFATDFSEECRKPFAKAQEFAASFGAQLHLLYVNTPNDFKTSSEAKKMMDNFLKNTNAEGSQLHVYNDTSVEKGILGFAREHQVQLIGMSTHGRKGIAHFFNGSISEDLVNHANMPVMTFKI
ncbi:MAG TPA: universal stress protein [Flavobacteriaceae bacterium]|nr:universal stress protein [Flavobacteriaceae bacterium]MCB9212258.1 universal stress protein [Alteromonas sp.]HPF10363.1 universal stress protein [Flavobacteriaceae bacterium]HQU20427.1 universal stress protein [Flavobacteriaceae bacterium]HQU65765.1 universal stress protein [Flavobacteriaceae bacterium]